MFATVVDRTSGVDALQKAGNHGVLLVSQTVLSRYQPNISSNCGRASLRSNADQQQQGVLRLSLGSNGGIYDRMRWAAIQLVPPVVLVGRWPVPKFTPEPSCRI